MGIVAGGRVAPEGIVGRDELIERLWEVLEGKSAMLAGERRTGKTCVMDRMVYRGRPGWILLKRDLEGLMSRDDLVHGIEQDLTPHLRLREQAAGKGREAASKLQMVGLMGCDVQLDLTQPFRDNLLQLLRAAAKLEGRRVLFLWDEFPVYLNNLTRTRDEGPEAAIAVLNTLREFRETGAGDRVRFLFSGSIGLHHTLAALRRRQMQHRPHNDVEMMDVPPLVTGHAATLAEVLLTGSSVSCVGGDDAVAAAVATAAENRPFWIHRIVDGLAELGREVRPGDADAVVTAQLWDRYDPWDMRHYRERIGEYYRPYDAAYPDLALAVLDLLSQATTPVGPDDVMDRLPPPVTATRNDLLELLELLCLDHYLDRTDHGYRFRTQLVARWWRRDRHLTP